MNKKRFVLAFFTAFVSLSTFAQNCPQGIPQGTPSCVPPDQLGYSTAPPVNTAYWKKTWGALASSPEMREIGTSTGQFSRRSAVKEAIRNCKSKGGKACELSLAYHNQCVVMAQPIRESGQSSSVNSISQSAPTIESASQLALPNCSKLNEGKKCEIFYSNCTAQVLIR